MNPGVAPVLNTTLNLNTLLPLAREMLGYSPASKADKLNLNGIAHNLMCLATFEDVNCESFISQVSLVNVGFLIAASCCDLLAILSITSNMASVVTETMVRDVSCAIITGTVEQWTWAVKRGSSSKKSREVRVAFNKIYNHFCDMGLRMLFADLKATPMPDHTFLLEGNR